MELLRSSAVDYIPFFFLFVAVIMGHPRTIFSSPYIYLRASLILYPCLRLVCLETSNHNFLTQLCAFRTNCGTPPYVIFASILSLFSFLTLKYSHQHFILRSCFSAQIFVQCKYYRVVVLLCRTYKISGC